MSTQLQLRKGTEIDNTAFTGAEGELTYATDSHGLRIHDGVTQGGHSIDVVVFFQAPTAENNYTWARKYASGWVEQGGVIPLQTTSVTMPIEMENSNYQVILTYPKTSNTNNVTFVWIGTATQSTTGFTVVATQEYIRNWRTEGMAA